MNDCCYNPPYYITAYGLSVRNGFKGTEQEWLDSLNAYLHIKFAPHLPLSDEDMTDTPSTWLGIANTKSPVAPEEYTQYTWIYLKGEADAQILAPAYNEKRVYSVGSVVSFGQGVYRSIVPIETPEPFNPDHWQFATLAKLIEEAKEIPAGAVTEDKLAPNAVTASKLADGAVIAQKLAEGAVTTEKLAENAITADKLAQNSITSDKLAEGAVTSDKLAENAVTGNMLNANSVTTDKIADRAVTGAKLKLDNGDLGTIKLTKNVHYYDLASQAPTQEGVLSFIKATE